MRRVKDARNAGRPGSAGRPAAWALAALVAGALVAAPVLAEGDVIGCVTILSGELAARAGEVEIKVAQAAARCLGKQLEE